MVFRNLETIGMAVEVRRQKATFWETRQNMDMRPTKPDWIIYRQYIPNESFSRKKVYSALSHANTPHPLHFEIGIQW